MNKDGGCHRPPALTIDPPPTSPINDGASVGVVVNTDETTATSTSQTPPSLLAASTSSFFQKNHLTSSSSETCAESSASSTTTTTATTIGVGAAFVGQLQHPPLRRRPVSAMASLPWIAYQQQRDDSSHLTTSTPTSSNINDDDDDCALDSALFLSTSPSCFPSPIPGSVSSLALSPPGLSPLNFNDGSPFSISSTPSSSSSHINRNRFTFDHIPFVGSSSSSSSATAATTTTLASTQKSAFEVVSSVNVNEILQRVRLGTSSGSSSSATSASSTRTSQCQSISGDSGIGEKSAESSSRQYLCQTCKKDFKRPDILSRHLRRHTGEKPFGCDACGRFFSRSDHLRTHRRTHTDEKPYQCTQCSYSARRRDVLTRHMITRHQTNAPISSLSASHRNVRRCHSDGDCHRVTAVERRQRRNQTITKTAARPTSESVDDNDDDADVVVVDDDV